MTFGDFKGSILLSEIFLYNSHSSGNITRSIYDIDVNCKARVAVSLR